MLSYVSLLVASSIFTYTVTALSTSDCTQVPQQVGSEDVPASKSCVASGEELYQAFLMRGLTPYGKYHFNVHSPDWQYYMRFSDFTVVYNTTTLTEDANDNVNMAHTLPDSSSDRCCNDYPSNKDCYVVQTTRQTVYKVLPSPLVFMLALPWLTPFSRTGDKYVMLDFISHRIFIGCWSTPPLCACHQSIHEMMNDFTIALIRGSYGTENGSDDLQGITDIIWPVRKVSENGQFSSAINVISALMSLLTLPPALMILKRYKPPRDRPTRALWMAIQINSWLQFSVYIAGYLISFRIYHAYLADAPQEVSTVLMPYATIGNYFVIALGCIFLLELPFIMWYFVRKEQQWTTTMGNKWSFRLKMLAHSLGYAGIALFLQIMGGYSVFFFFLLLASPLTAVSYFAAQTNATVFLILFTALLIYPCMARNTGRKCFRGCGLLLYLSLGSFGVLGYTFTLAAVANDNITAPLNVSQIATSIMSSSLLGLMAYTAKRTLWHHLLQSDNAERQDEEAPLLGPPDSVE